MPTDFVITVMSVDRVGIISGISEAVLELAGNIDAISQTVLRGYFTVIVTAAFDGEVEAGQVAEAIRRRGGPGELGVQVKERDPDAAGPVVGEAERFVLTITGPDRKGIIHRVCSHLASRSINIEDLYATVEDGSFLLLAQLQVPAGRHSERVQMEVQDLWPESEVRVTLQHENIFLATSHVDFHQPAVPRPEEE